MDSHKSNKIERFKTEQTPQPRINLWIYAYNVQLDALCVCRLFRHAKTDPETPILKVASFWYALPPPTSTVHDAIWMCTTTLCSPVSLNLSFSCDMINWLPASERSSSWSEATYLLKVLWVLQGVGQECLDALTINRIPLAVLSWYMGLRLYSF